MFWVCGEVCGAESAKCYLLLFSFLNKSTEISQQTSPCTKAPNPKESTRWPKNLHQIYLFQPWSHSLDYQFVGPVFGRNTFQSGSHPRMQVQGGYSKDSDFFSRRNCAVTSREHVVQQKCMVIEQADRDKPEPKNGTAPFKQMPAG